MRRLLLIPLLLVGAAAYGDYMSAHSLDRDAVDPGVTITSDWGVTIDATVSTRTDGEVEPLFGFNQETWGMVEYDIYDDDDTPKLKAQMASALSEMSGASLRHPGGLASQRYNIYDGVGTVSGRGAMRRWNYDTQTRAEYATEEWCAQKNLYGLQGIYVANLIGIAPAYTPNDRDDDVSFASADVTGRAQEEPTDDIGAAATFLAQWMNDNDCWRSGETPLIQMGNEVGRAEWEYSPEWQAARIQAFTAAFDAVATSNSWPIMPEYILDPRHFDWTSDSDESLGDTWGTFGFENSDETTNGPTVNRMIHNLVANGTNAADGTELWYYNAQGIDNAIIRDVCAAVENIDGSNPHTLTYWIYEDPDADGLITDDGVLADSGTIVVPASTSVGPQCDTAVDFNMDEGSGYHLVMGTDSTSLRFRRDNDSGASSREWYSWNGVASPPEPFTQSNTDTQAIAIWFEVEATSTWERYVEVMMDDCSYCGDVDHAAIHRYVTPYDDAAPTSASDDQTIPGHFDTLGYPALMLAEAHTYKPNAKLFITEHARIYDFGAGYTNADLRLPMGNMFAGVINADYIMAMLQINGLTNATQHVMQSEAWQLLDVNQDGGANDYSANAVLESQLALRRLLDTTPIPLESASEADEDGEAHGHSGSGIDAYTMRGQGFRNSAGSKLGVWVINYNNTAVDYDITVADLADETGVSLAHSYVAGEASQAFDPSSANAWGWTVEDSPTPSSVSFNGSGLTTVSIPPMSVNSLVFTMQAPASSDTDYAKLVIGDVDTDLDTGCVPPRLAQALPDYTADQGDACPNWLLRDYFKLGDPDLTTSPDCGDLLTTYTTSGDSIAGCALAGTANAPTYAGTTTSNGSGTATITADNSAGSSVNDSFDWVVNSSETEDPLTESGSLFVGTGGNDTNNCSNHASRCASPARALAVQNTNGQNIYLLQGGSYVISAPIDTRSGASAGNTTKIQTYYVSGGQTFESSDPDTFAIIQSNSASVYPMLETSGTDSFVEFKNIRLRWTAKPASLANRQFVQIGGSGSGIILDGVCVLADDAGSCDMTDWISDHVTQGSAAEVAALASQFDSESIDIVQIQGPDDVVVKNSILVGQTRHGIRLWSRSRDARIENNVIGFGFGDGIRGLVDVGQDFRAWSTNNLVGGGQISDGLQTNPSTFAEGTVDAFKWVSVYDEFVGSVSGACNENGFDPKGAGDFWLIFDAIHGNQGDNNGCSVPGDSGSGRGPGRRSEGLNQGNSVDFTPVMSIATAYYDNLAGADAGRCMAHLFGTFVANNRDFNGTDQPQAENFMYGLDLYGSLCATNAVLNNIFSHHHGWPYINVLGGSDWQGRIDGNVIWGDGGSPTVRFESSNITDIASLRSAWQAKTSVEGHEENSEFTDPQFSDINSGNPVGLHQNLDFSTAGSFNPAVPVAYAASGGSGTSINVDNGNGAGAACLFWDGEWGPSNDALGIYIKVGSASPVYVTANGDCSDGSGSTLTLSGSISWSNNDPIYYSTSGGTLWTKGQCASGTCPTIGISEP